MTAPGVTPSVSISRSGLPKESRPLAPIRVQVLQVDGRFLGRDHQEERVLLVLEEQVLGVGARNLAAERLRLLDGEERRMLDRGGGDAEAASMAIRSSRVAGIGTEQSLAKRPILPSAGRQRYKPGSAGTTIPLGRT